MKRLDFRRGGKVGAVGAEAGAERRSGTEARACNGDCRSCAKACAGGMDRPPATDSAGRAEPRANRSGMRPLFRFRGWIQAAAALLSNGHISGFFKGGIYSGPLKQVCVPGLNCYSCPGALGACPIGAMQAVISGNRHNFSFYVFGILALFGVLLGRAVCGFLCPFGWLQELLHKIPVRKLRVRREVDRPLRFFKYGVLALFVLALPAFAVDAVGLGAPWFCKWICPAGTLEGGIPLALANAGLRAGLGLTFWWKIFLLILVLAFSMVIYRPFCKYLCPLGAFYALFNRWSLVRLEVDRERCTACGACERACPMQAPILKNINSAECIRCGKCASVCPHSAIGRAGRGQKERGEGAAAKSSAEGARRNPPGRRRKYGG